MRWASSSPISEAVVKVKVDGETFINRRARATARSMRSTWRCARISASTSAYIDDLELVDYKVRILNGGTGATTRVLIESRDGKGDRWFTVGVSPNIVDASFQALSDSIIYKLSRDARDLPSGRHAGSSCVPEWAHECRELGHDAVPR